MLTYPDRHKFERIRSQWETGQPSSEGSLPAMVSRKGKKAAPEEPTDVPVDSGASRFRRKLSHGLSFISSPLLQRKVTPGRQAPGSMATAAAAHAIIASPNNEQLVSSSDNLISCSSAETSLVDHSPSEAANTLDTCVDRDPTPRPIPPRARTMSFIPRPSIGKLDSLALKAGAPSTAKPRISSINNVQSRRVSSKIPTPSPPRDGPRHVPRQYVSSGTVNQTKQVMAAATCAGASSHSPSKASVRSYTTPNLTKTYASPRHPTTVPRKARTMQQATGSPMARTTLKENAPTAVRNSRRLSGMQAFGNRRDILVPQANPANRHSLGSTSAPQSKQKASSTSRSSEKRLGTKAATSTPPTTRKTSKAQQEYRKSGATIDQPRLMRPVSPPTPALTDASGSSIKSGLPRASTEKNFRRIAIDTLSRRGSTRLPSSSSKDSSSEVRLPRSSTFHHIPRKIKESLPPVPAIPDRFKDKTSLHATYKIVGKSQDGFRSQDADFSTSRQHLLEEGLGRDVSDVPRLSSEITFESRANLSEPQTSSTTEAFNAASVPTPKSGEDRKPSAVAENSDPYADINTWQVQDHMPPVWWAGRFQSRLDQWRTQAMRAETEPGYRADGPLGQCKLAQEDTAACHILLQLRELCCSRQAADSLWEFEYRYRRDHRLLGSMGNLPPISSRKQDDSTRVGRAIRRLTPRKSSLVNLIKGRGWTRIDETKSMYSSSGADLLSAIGYGKTSADD